ncbi:nucleotide disphospho-sugar-binding domain-containing protein [Nocardia sp. NPDC020380]|uniref:nucleotide disphospho-sugar-binding domain-containing protein n=1 Tax=Nocardia sp. NPDC020380 TaxID=3364309 RepID=UPI00379074BB
MRILCTTFPWHSHHFPMVPLEWACQTAGHEVRVASTPALTDTIIESGLPAIAVGKDVDLVRMSTDRRRKAWHTQERWPEDWPIRPELLGARQRELIADLGRMQVAMAESMVDDLIEFGRYWRPDLIVHDAVTLAGPVAAAVLGVPSVSHLWGAPGWQRIEMRDLGDEPLPEYAALYAARGSAIRVVPDAWIDPCPPAMRYAIAGHCLPMQYVPYNGPGVLPEWLLEPVERPRVCVTWGGTAVRLDTAPIELVRKVIEAAATLEVEVVLAVTQQLADRLGVLPAGVRTAVDLPLTLLLPSCAGVVHHGGAGTTVTAARHGVSQLSITSRPEPALTGSRLAATGAGRHLAAAELPEGAAAVDILRAELAVLLNEPSYRAAGAEVRAGIVGQPTPAEVVGSLEQLV